MEMTPMSSIVRKAAKGLLIFGILITGAQNLAASDTSSLPGAFLDIGLGAAPMGLGGAASVLGQDAYTIVSNPAGLVSLNGPELAFSTTKQFALVPYNIVLYGQKLGSRMALGGGFLTSGDEALRENTIYLSYAYRLRKRVALGTNFKLRFASFGDNADGAWIFEGGNRQVQGNAKGFGVDVGARVSLANHLGLAVVLKDAFATMKYNASNEVGTALGGNESPATSVLVGLAYVAKRTMNVELDLHKSIDDETEDRLSLGVEKWLFSFIAIRGGISQNIQAAEANRHYALGAGLAPNFLSSPLGFSLDFAYQINHIDNFYHAGLRVFWGKK